MKVRILSLVLASLVPLQTIHTMAIWGRKTPVTKFDWALFMPPVVTKPGPAQAQAFSSLLRILPSKNSFAYALFGGAALAIAAVVAYKALSTSEVQKFNRVILLLDKELSKFFYNLKLYQSDDFKKLYTLRSREYAYLKQFDIPGISSTSSQFPGINAIIPSLIQQNPKLKEIIDKIRNIDTKLLSKNEQDDLIKYIEVIAYQISQFFNLHVKDTRAWYKQAFSNPISHPLSFDEKKDILIPLAINIKAIETLLRGKKIRGDEQFFYPDRLTKIFDAARKLLSISPSENSLDTFIEEAAPGRTDV